MNVIDVRCGSRMFWFDKHRKDVVFMDNRQLDTTLCDGRRLLVQPDVLGDFRSIPYPDNTFNLVVFDPPHLISVGEKAWIGKKYGKLEKTWREDLKRGFDECFRVLKPNGVLVFKWNEDQIKLRDVLAAVGHTPLIGDKRSKTHWLIFMKDGVVV